MILGLCRRFYCTPDVAEQMDASVLRLLRIEELGARDDGAPDA